MRCVGGGTFQLHRLFIPEFLDVALCHAIINPDSRHHKARLHRNEVTERL